MKRFALVSAAAWTMFAPLAQAQEPAPPEAEAPAEAAPEAPRKPKPRPKPQAKPQPPAEDKARDKPAQASREAPQPAPIPAPSPAATLFAAPPVACEPGQAVQYEGGPGGPKDADKRAELWVTRSGAITIDNPLRPLTPDVTRVLQVVIGGKVATAYGPDLLSLRRGASPAVLEGTVGGAVRWDAALANLPDTLPIHADSGQALAEFRFRACGTAPAAKSLPAPKARRTTPTEAEMAAAAAREAKESAREAKKSNPGAAPKPPALSLPQGAIP